MGTHQVELTAKFFKKDSFFLNDIRCKTKRSWPIRWWGLRPAMAIRLANASVYLEMSIEHWEGEDGEEDTLKQQANGRRWWCWWCTSLKPNERLKLFGGILEMEAKRPVRVGEDRISPRPIATFCHNKNHFAFCLTMKPMKIFSTEINNLRIGASFIS